MTRFDQSIEVLAGEKGKLLKEEPTFTGFARAPLLPFPL